MSRKHEHVSTRFEHTSHQTASHDGCVQRSAGRRRRALLRAASVGEGDSLAGPREETRYILDCFEGKCVFLSAGDHFHRCISVPAGEALLFRRERSFAVALQKGPSPSDKPCTNLAAGECAHTHVRPSKHPNVAILRDWPGNRARLEPGFLEPQRIARKTMTECLWDGFRARESGAGGFLPLTPTSQF